MTDKPDDTDWSLATWEGAQRESLRRWAKLPLERIIAALEEMQELNKALHGSDMSAAAPRNLSGVQESSRDYTIGEKSCGSDNK